MDANSHTTSFVYDDNANQIKRTLPGSQAERFHNDQFGRMIWHKDFDGQVTAYDYDTDPRYGGREIGEYRFANGNSTITNGTLQTALTNANERTLYGYDTLGRRTTVNEYVKVGGSWGSPSA